MKKIQNFFLMGTVALTGMAGLTACSSDSEPLDGNQPGVAGQTVKTQFALNIPYANNSTRMTDKNTQADKKYFLGIQHLQLLAFDNTPADGGEAKASINIGSGDNAYDRDQWRSVYRDVEIPVGTCNFVLYGRAGREDGLTNADLGALSMQSDYSKMTKLSEIEFNLEKIAPNADFSTNQNAQTIVRALTDLANVKVVVTAEGSEETKEVEWKNIDTYSEDDANKFNLGSLSERKLLKESYNKLIKLTAGSTASVKSFIAGLLDFFGEENIEGAKSKLLTKEIITKAEDVDVKLSSTVDFPESLGLPDGVAKIKWNETNSEFAYEGKATMGEGNNIDYTKITYPATLAYFISSPAMSSTAELTSVTQLPNYDNWVKDEGPWTGFTETAVTSNTRSVALKKALQYGVASLKLSVKCNTQTLEDNATSQGYKENQQINVPAGGFPVTAVLVGGQPSGVKWNMEALSTDLFDCTVYDTKMNVDNNGYFTAKYVTDSNQYNYTLLLDNNNSDTKGKVYVTIELENVAGDFYCKDGLVPKNSKFYLVGLLDKDATSGVSNGANRDRVFEKDYTTTVNLSINSLKNAYNCIPDLRTSKISLGLAVDLSWSAGITFDVDIM